jgi:uncharacterized protein (TIGR03086 family)
VVSTNKARASSRVSPVTSVR